MDESVDGYSSIRSRLEGDNYDVRTLWWNPSEDNVSVPDTPRRNLR